MKSKADRRRRVRKAMERRESSGSRLTFIGGRVSFGGVTVAEAVSGLVEMNERFPKLYDRLNNNRTLTATGTLLGPLDIPHIVCEDSENGGG